MSFQTTPGIVEFTHEWREVLNRRKSVCEVAVSISGARRIRCEDFHYRWGMFPERTARRDLLLVESKAFAICPCAGGPPRNKPSCEQARRWGKPDGVGQTTGIPVEQRRVDLGNASTRIRFAPGFGCEQMQLIETTYQFGLPTARSSNTVTRLQPGEPDPSNFRIPPAGSQRVEGFPPERHP